MFDLSCLIKNKCKSIHNIKSSSFYQFIESDLVSRLEPLDKTYGSILYVDLGFFRATEPSTSHLKLDLIGNNPTIKFTNTDDLHHIQKKSMDLIYFPFGLHWIANMQEFLFSICSILKEDGVFICNFAGAGSLNNLRKTIFLAEEQAGSPHFPHIIPFIRFDDTTELLKRAGFNENITDFENIELEYKSPIELMRALKNYGESNVLASRTNYSLTKKTYQMLVNSGNCPFFDQINLITLISSPTKNSIRLKSTYFFK